MFLYAVTKIATNDEMVKQMQEQVISMQDKQISFLNSTITTILAVAAIIVTLVSLVLAGLATYIGNTSRKAKKTMEEAQSVLGDVKTARSELLQDMSNLAIYREETRQEFEELKALVNSDEINKIKENMGFLYKEKEVNHQVDQLKQMVQTGDKLLNALKENDISVDFSTNARFETCKERTQYYAIKSKQLMYDRSGVDDLLERCTNLQRKCIDVINTLRERLRDGTREFEESLSREDDEDID